MKSQRVTVDYDRLVSDVAAEIWNRIIGQSPFGALQPKHFAELFQAVSDALRPYYANGQYGKRPPLLPRPRSEGSHPHPNGNSHT